MNGRTVSGSIKISPMWQAVQHQLEECKRRLGLTGLALANEDGLLIASSEDNEGAELVAAISPLHRDEGALVALRHDLEQSGQGLEILDLQSGKQALFLCATGRDESCRRPELKGFLQELAMKLGL